MRLFLLLILTSCGSYTSKVDPSLDRYLDEELGIACYKINKVEHLECMESRLLIERIKNQH